MNTLIKNIHTKNIVYIQYYFFCLPLYIVRAQKLTVEMDWPITYT